MEIRQVTLARDEPLPGRLAELAPIDPHLVLVFASPAMLEDGALVSALGCALPRARRIGCSTAGEISSSGVGRDGAVVTAVRFTTPALRTARAALADMDRSADSGRELGRALAAPDLRAVMVYGQGVRINGSAVIRGVAEAIGPDVPISGGLAGDDGAFRRTFVVYDDDLASDAIVGVGFYGRSLRFAHGCYGGWEPFGPPRRITRAEGNVLYELDGAPALDLYKRYLGEYAQDLPASGLMFPFELLDDTRSDLGLIRTILGVDEASRSLTLAGDLVDGGYLRLMHASVDWLVAGAESAAHAARATGPRDGDALAILVSCIGRRLTMGDRVEEEVEAVSAALGDTTTIAGFYSNGEIGPSAAGPECKLHNQTMTVTHLYECAPA